jgi:hypothetical protein
VSRFDPALFSYPAPWRQPADAVSMAGMAVSVVRYSDRPQLWRQITQLSDEVWPEYNVHGEIISRHWPYCMSDSPTINSCCTTTNLTP